MHILYLMMLQASSKALLQRRSQRRCFLVNFVEFLRVPFFPVKYIKACLEIVAMTSK